MLDFISYFAVIFIILAVFCIRYEFKKFKVTKFHITQIRRNKIMAITGVKQGGQGTFAETPLPIGVKLPAGIIPVWSTTDSLVTLTPAADGSSCVAAVDMTDANTSFPLTVTATLLDGTTPNGTVTVPILAAEVTGFQIDQTA